MTEDTATTVAPEDQAAASASQKNAPQDNATQVDPDATTKEALQKQAEALGVPKSGNKDEIAQRIAEAQAGTDSEEGSTEGGRGVGLRR